MTDKVIFLKNADTSPWTVPSDFGPVNKVICLAPGSSGSTEDSGRATSRAGGGGAASVSKNLTWSVGASIYFQVPAGAAAVAYGPANGNDATDCWINTTNSAPASGQGCLAKGGLGGHFDGTIGTGGAAASGYATGTGSAKFSGGTGGAQTGAGGASGGGGGSGGETASGNNGASTATATGGIGGTAEGGIPTSYTANTGTYNTQTVSPGAGAAGENISIAANAGNLYGGGGSAGADFHLTSGAGAAGIIIIIYTPLQVLTLTAAVGSYVLTGIAAVLKLGKGMLAAAGAYILTGKAATINSVRTLTAAKGTFTLSGIAAIVKRAVLMTAIAGAYTLSGIAATLRKKLTLTAANGTYTLSGVAAVVKKALFLTAAKGTYVLTGVAASLNKTLHLTAAKGTLTLTGITLVIANFIAPTNKFKRRLADFKFQKLRTNNPTLED
jgi:hypothetical protein